MAIGTLSRGMPFRLDISMLIVFMLCLATGIRGWRIHNNIRNKLRDGKIPSIKIKGIIKSVEYVKQQTIRGEIGNVIAGRYISVEAIDPLSKKKRTYESEEFKYSTPFRKSRFASFKKNKAEFDRYIQEYAIVGDAAEIIISKENPKIYCVVVSKRKKISEE